MALGAAGASAAAAPRPTSIALPGRAPSAPASALQGFTVTQNKAHVRGLNPVFKHIFLSVTLKMSPRKPEWDLLCCSAPLAGYCLPSEVPFYLSHFSRL